MIDASLGRSGECRVAFFTGGWITPEKGNVSSSNRYGASKTAWFLLIFVL
jgi:hypothetical protein